MGCCRSVCRCRGGVPCLNFIKKIIFFFVKAINQARQPLGMQNELPMENADKNFNLNLIADDERLMHSAVIGDDADLFYIDCYLQELFRCEN